MANIIDLDAFVEAQVRFNAQIARILDEAEIISRKDFAASLRSTADKIGGKAGECLRGQAFGMTDGLPPDLTVIEGDKDRD